MVAILLDEQALRKRILQITVRITPPTVNHYMKHRVAMMNGKPTVVAYPSKEAKAWWKAVAAASGLAPNLSWDGYEVAYVVYQGHNERGDVDNYAKVILDGIVRAGVIDTDHKVTAMHAYKARDRANPRTEIFIREAGQMSLLEPPMPKAEDW